jgi:hypothetical protein
MALNFPDSPTLNQIHTDTTSGFSYQWDGVVWQSYSPAASKNIRVVDDISGSFDGVTDNFSLSVLGESLTPSNAQQLRVVLGGIVQEPLTDYTVSGSNITFTTPPTGGLDCSIVSLGPAVPVSVPGDGTVTPVKLSTGGPYWNTDGDVVITGTGTTALLVNGNARVTGILTVGTSSITLDGTNNTINVGSLSISQGGISGGTPNINVGFITATGASISGNVSISGTLTYEDVTNVDSVGIITARSGVNVTGGSVVVGSAVTLSSGGINVAGVVTSTSFSGSGASLTTLNASNLASGTVPDARFPATLPSASGANLTSLNASNLASGTVPTARLASGTANSSSYLRGDQTWASITSGITITDDTSTNATRYLTFTSATSGTISAENVSSSKLTYNPSTGTLTASAFKSTAPGALGSTYEGGILICKSGGIAMIVAPLSSEVSREWGCRADANTRAGEVSCCLGWFVPTRGQLITGYDCRTYWDSYSVFGYWSATTSGACEIKAATMNFCTGNCACFLYRNTLFCVRSFRCVTY